MTLSPTGGTCLMHEVLCSMKAHDATTSSCGGARHISNDVQVWWGWTWCVVWKEIYFMTSMLLLFKKEITWCVLRTWTRGDVVVDCWEITPKTQGFPHEVSLLFLFFSCSCSSSSPQYTSCFMVLFTYFSWNLGFLIHV